MRIGLATSAFPDLSIVDGVQMCFRYADHVHLSPIYGKVSAKEVSKLIELQKTFGVDYSVHAPLGHDGKHLDLGSKDSMTYFRNSIKIASKLNADRVVFHTPHDKHHNKETFKNAKTLVSLCSKSKITACFENMADSKSQLYDKKDILKFVKKVPGARFCFDVGHYYMHHENMKSLVDAISSIAKSIGCIHLSDTFKAKDAHMLPGFGEIVLYELMPAFLKIPDLKNTPIILEDQEPFEFEKGLLNTRHALIGKRGMMKNQGGLK